MAMTAAQKQAAKEKREAKKAADAAEMEAAYQAIVDNFTTECQTEGTQLHDDPVWNPHHPLHRAVNALIGQGLTASAAVTEAANIGVETIIKEEQDAEAALEEMVAWLAEQTWSDFAQSLASQYKTRGSLSPKQAAAGFSMMEKVQAKQEAKKAEKPVTGLDLSALKSGYYAVPGGDTRLKLRVSRGKEGGNWAGTIFVNDDAAYGQRTLYGMQKPGEVYKGKVAEALETILANPLEASMAYGKLVGRCGVCGKRLEDANSVAAGIGPICAAGY